MVDQLFGSKTRVKLLQLFFSNPNRSFYVREMTRKIDEQINSVRRELSNLLSIGIIKSNADNNRLYYEVDQEYEYYQPLAMIFGGLQVSAGTRKKLQKTMQKNNRKLQLSADVIPEHPLAKSIRGTGHIELAFLTGQFTRDDLSGIDLLIVGDTNQIQGRKFYTRTGKNRKERAALHCNANGNI
jgi:predicted transcriptional regulator